MERESQSAHSRLITALQGRMSEVNVYRFCQLLERVAPDKPALGSTASPHDDPVRFRPHPGMGFPVSELKAIEQDEEHPERPLTVRTTFLGLYGVDSPLPTSYLDDIAQGREGHEALEAFLDIFNHRIFTQFYRIWRKYSYPATFQVGGTDETSQCLLGLIGLGIPGTSSHIATPVSRFLALLSVMRLPTRTAEGVMALVRLLAPKTTAIVTAHDRQQIVLQKPAGLGPTHRVNLSQRAVLGATGTDVNTQMLLTLHTTDLEEAKGWLPGGQLHTDLMVLLRVYLGWRCNARLKLVLPTVLLPSPVLGKTHVQLGLTGLLGLHAAQSAAFALPDEITVNLGHYQGLQPNTANREVRHVNFRF